MGVSVQFTPLYGAHSPSRAHAYLLSIDNTNLLLDCGWDASFSPEAIAPFLAPHLPQIHAVLLSHPHLSHLGALPYAFARLNLPKATPVFATLPVWRMGQMFLYDAFQSARAQRDVRAFDLDHVDAAFETRGPAARFRLLKYHQDSSLACVGAPGVVITPHPAGHMLGGTVWAIQKDTEQIVYALDVNHRREHHLNATTLATFPRPSHLIFGAANAPTRTRALRTKHIMRPIVETIRGGGNVLIPVDTAGRVIELAVELNDAWTANRHDLALPNSGDRHQPSLPPHKNPRKNHHHHHPSNNQRLIPLIVLHEFSTRTFDFARTMIEFMSDRVVKKFDTTRENLFDFKHLRCCHTRAQVDAIPGPKVVLASSASLEIGFSRDLFLDWAPDPKNGIVLVERPEPDTLAAQLAPHAVDGNCDVAPPRKSAGGDGFTVEVAVRRRGRLEGDALREWREKQESIAREKEQREMEAQNALRAAAAAAAAEEEGTGLHTAEMEVDTETPNPQEIGGGGGGGGGDGMAQGEDSEIETGSVVPAAAPQDSANPPEDPGVDGSSNSDSGQSGKKRKAPTSDSSSEDEDDDDDYDTALIMGAAAARRPAGGQLLGGRQRQRDLTLPAAPSGPPAALPGSAPASNPVGSMALGGGGGGGPGAGAGAAAGLGSSVLPSSVGESGAAAAGQRSMEGAEAQQELAGRGKGQWDDYGQSIGLKRFAIGEDPSSAMHDASLGGDPAIGPSDYANVNYGSGPGHGQGPIPQAPYETEDIPIEYTVEERKVDVRCSLVAVDRSGLSEGDALKHLVKELEPRRVILVNGTQEETEHLRDHLANTLFAKRNDEPSSSLNGSGSKGKLRRKYTALDPESHGPRQSSGAKTVAEQVVDEVIGAAMGVVKAPSVDGVVCPKAGETVDVTSDTSVQSLLLDKEVASKIRWNHMGTSSIGYLDGSIAVNASPADGSDDAGSEEPDHAGDEPAVQRAVIVPVESALCVESGDAGDGVQAKSTRSAASPDETHASQKGETQTMDDTAGGVGVDAMDTALIPSDACAEFIEPPVSHPTIFVGTVMLGRLKNAMSKAGVRAELADGVLCVQNHETGAVVLVKKGGSRNDTVVIEGALSEEYYIVRDIIYNELVVVSA